MNFAIAILLVAAGDGAFRQCNTLLPIVPTPPSKTKSSTSLPSLSSACALTPVGPLRKITKKIILRNMDVA